MDLFAAKPAASRSRPSTTLASVTVTAYVAAGVWHHWTLTRDGHLKYGVSSSCGCRSSAMSVTAKLTAKGDGASTKGSTVAV